MHTYFEDMSTRLFSPRVWKGFAPPTAFGPYGGCATGESGNPAFGFFDDFLAFDETTLVGPYANLVTAAGTLAKAADTAAAPGILSATLVGDTEEDETVLKWGSTLSAPFLLRDRDLAFEIALSFSDITTAKHSIAVGLGAADMITTDLLFTDADVLADKNFCGFVSLIGEAGVFDGAYKAAGETYQDGATKTKLNALATFTASLTTYIKLGMRFRAHPKTLEWYVNGAALATIAPARLTATEVDAATFPDEAADLLAPIIGLKDKGADTAQNMQVDWWACAQYE